MESDDWMKLRQKFKDAMQLTVDGEYNNLFQFITIDTTNYPVKKITDFILKEKYNV
jgi:hypothetical protein